MAQLRSSDMRALLDVMEQLLSVRTFADVETLALPAVAHLLRSDQAVYHHVDLRADALQEVDVLWPLEEFRPLLQVYSSVMAEHPFVQRFAEALPSCPMRISDYLSARQWRSSAVYQVSHRPLGAHHQMSHVLASRRTAVRAVTAARLSPAYTDRERDLLAALGPHLRAALERAYARSPGFVAQRIVPVVEPFLLGRVDEVLHRPAAGHAALTDRENEILELVALGLTNAQVGRRLQIATATVAKHLEHAYGKLRVDNRVSAARLLSQDA